MRLSGVAGWSRALGDLLGWLWFSGKLYLCSFGLFVAVSTYAAHRIGFLVAVLIATAVTLAAFWFERLSEKPFGLRGMEAALLVECQRGLRSWLVYWVAATIVWVCWYTGSVAHLGRSGGVPSLAELTLAASVAGLRMLYLSAKLDRSQASRSVDAP
jgi:hypothetical protein